MKVSEGKESESKVFLYPRFNISYDLKCDNPGNNWSRMVFLTSSVPGFFIVTDLPLRTCACSVIYLLLHISHYVRVHAT
jgi:hypothetical protein